MIIGLPVAPKETVEQLRKEADHVELVASASSYFNSVGQYYQASIIKYFEPEGQESVVEMNCDYVSSSS